MRAREGQEVPPRAPPRDQGLGADIPVPNLSLAEVGQKLAAFYSEVGATQFQNLDQTDGIVWARVKSDLQSNADGLFYLAVACEYYAAQLAAYQTYETQAQASIASLQSQLTACTAAQTTPSVPTSTATWFAVGSAAAAGILGFVGGSFAAKGKWWPWTR